MQKRKWYILDVFGKFEYVGEFSSFDDADEYLNRSGKDNYIWLFDEQTKKEYIKKLAQLE